MFLLLVLAAVQTADAAACAYGDAPVGYANQSCRDVCTYYNDSGPDRIVCDLAENGITTGGAFYSATSWGSSPRDYSFWGTDTTGDNFCCTYDEVDEVDEIVAWGGDHDDVMYFGNGVVLTGAQHLSDPGGWENFILRMEGEGGDDFLRGSNGTGVTNNVINGGPDDDNIACNEGCVADGDDGDDTILGSEDDDDLVGGFGVDRIAGGDGADNIFGGPDQNFMCGDGGHDYVYGGSGDDYLWGGAQYDILEGEYGYSGGTPGTNACEGEEMEDCELTLMARPEECPGSGL